MGNGLNSLHSFCVDPLKSAGKLPLPPKALELAHIVRFQKVSNSGQEIDREDNAICSKQKFVSYKATVLNATYLARSALFFWDI